MSREDERKRRSSYFPNAALNKGYSLDSRFMGGLQPSPTGSYYNPSRYSVEGFSQQQQNRIQSNLATNYTKDQEFNRLANPNFQTGQDTGYSSTAPFGSGRSSAATTQNYARTYGRPSGNGLSTFETPSGGSITYKPTGRTLGGGLPGGGAQPFNPLGERNIASARAYGESPAANTPGQLVNMQDGKSLGGDYIAKNGVFDPNVTKKPGFFSAFPAIAQLLMPRGMSAATAYGQNVSTGQGAGNQYANPSRNATPGATPQTGPDSQYFAYNPSPLRPRRFDFNYF